MGKGFADLPDSVDAMVLFSQQTVKPFLSNLSACKGFPLYTIYAAGKERSAFALDEGYEFRYDVDSLGADFTTDSGGDHWFSAALGRCGHHKTYIRAGIINRMMKDTGLIC